MQTIALVKNIEYYSKLANEDYYQGSGEPPGTWYGLGAQQLDLCESTIDDSAYKNLMNGYSPNGEKLVQNAGDDARRKAWDCTYSMPKSCSLIWAKSNVDLRQKIQLAQKISVERAIDFIERNAAITRRGKAGEKIERTSGLVFANYPHCTNRDQQVQIHTHALCMNAAPRKDGTWGSIDSRKLYQWQKASGAIYRAELAHQFREMGFQIEADNDSFHIAGISKDICRYFSNRSKAIEDKLKESGIKSSASKAGQFAKLSTRQYKAAVNHQELLTGWKKELDTLGFTTALLEEVQSLQPTLPTESFEEELLLEDITIKNSSFKRQDVYYQAAVQAATSGLTARQSEQAANSILASETIVKLKSEEAYTPKYTTQEVLDTEQSMISISKHLASQSTKSMDNIEIRDAIEKAESDLGFKFDDEQIEAVSIALNGPDLSITQGSAGAGKTTLMLAANHAYTEKGYRVQGACIAKQAADTLAEETGIESSTIASLISQIDRGNNPLSNTDVLIIDEAGQLPSNSLQQLLYCAEKSSCKLILTGENKQLDSINRGGALRYLSRPEIIGTQRIENIRRQRHGWSRQTVADLRDGDSKKALSVLNGQKCIHWSDNSAGTKEDLISNWHEYQKQNPKKNSLVMAHRWQDVKELSEIIRGIRISEGLVGTENVPLKCSVAEKQFEFEFSSGDRIKFCKNDYKNLKVSNGTLGTIHNIQKLSNGDVHLSIKTDDKRNASFLASEYCDERGTNISLAYALTIYSSQGTTVDGNTFIYYTGGMDRSNTYVAASRHKNEAHIFCNRKEIDERARVYDTGKSINDSGRLNMLARLMSRDSYSTLAIEELPEQQNQATPKIISELDIGL